MKRSVRAIIINNDNILLMRRDKFGTQYNILIGGHVQDGESLEKALYREVHEETMIRIANPKLVFIDHAEPPYGDQFVYVCDYISGVAMLHPEADERRINQAGDNVYTPVWVPLQKLKTLPFRSDELKQQILTSLEAGWPDQPIEFKSRI